MIEDGGMVDANEVGVGERRGLRWERVFLWALFGAGFLVRVWGISRMHVWDENVYLLNAEWICCGKNNYTEMDSRPPLLPLIFAGIFWVWHSDYAAWIATALINAAGPVILYLAGKMFVGRKPAAIAALLLAFTPFFVSVFPVGFASDTTGHSLLTDSPALTLILLAFWLLLRALEKEDGAALGSDVRFGGVGLVLAMTVLMRFPSLSSVGVLSLLLFAAKRRLRAMVACSVGFLVGLAPYLCWSRWRYGGFLATFLSGWDNFDGPRESPLFFVRNAGIIFSWVALAGLGLWVVQWGGRRWQVKSEGGWRALLRSPEAFLWMWALVLMAWFSALRHQEPRYVMPAAPPLFLLAGIGLATLLKGRRTWTRVGGRVVLVGALCWSFWPIWHRFETGFIDHNESEEMRVSEFLKQTTAPGTLIYANLSYPDFAYYADRKVEVLPEGGDDLYQSIDALQTDGMLIAYKRFDTGVTPEPSLGWLDANQHFRRVREFPTMVVYEFRKEVVSRK